MTKTLIYLCGNHSAELHIIINFRKGKHSFNCYFHISTVIFFFGVSFVYIITYWWVLSCLPVEFSSILYNNHIHYSKAPCSQVVLASLYFNQKACLLRSPGFDGYKQIQGQGNWRYVCTRWPRTQAHAISGCTKQVMKSWAGTWERGMYKATVYTYDAIMHYYLSVDVLDISSHGCQWIIKLQLNYIA